MPLTLLSPHDGRPVKIRDQDVGRAIRDSEGRIFYVVQREDGNGVYAALTRKGSPKDLERYQHLEERYAAGRTHAQESLRESTHDATGKSRGKLRRLVVLLVLLVLLAAAAAVTLANVAPGTVPAIDELVPDVLKFRSVDPDPAASLRQPVPGHVIPAVYQGDDIGFRETAEGLRVRTDIFAEGPRPKPGDFVRIHYVTYGPSGLILDRSQLGQPIGFTYWAGHAIRAWDLGLAGMAVGEQRTLLAPSHLIDPVRYPQPVVMHNRRAREVLRFQIELVEILPGATTETLIPGEGEPAVSGDALELHWLAFANDDAEPFHDTRHHGDPVRLTLGRSPVIPGLEVGLRGLKVGEARTITIPPYLAYGPTGVGPIIPPDATLTYRVRLVSLTPAQ